MPVPMHGGTCTDRHSGLHSPTSGVEGGGRGMNDLRNWMVFGGVDLVSGARVPGLADLSGGQGPSLPVLKSVLNGYLDYHTFETVR